MQAGLAESARGPVAKPTDGRGFDASLDARALPGENEVQFKALDQISPVTHAVGNTMRRVVIMLVCIFAFKTPVSLLGWVGSATAIGGTYAYAIAKLQEKKAEQMEAAEEEGEEVDLKVGEPFAHPMLPVLKAAGRVVQLTRG